MAQVYSWRFQVRTYELDASRQVFPATYLNYLEEGAVQASAAAGYDYDWYFANQRAWVIRKMTMRFYEPALYGDELELHTWVSNAKRVRSDREYDLRRAADDTPIVRARANWVFMNTETMQPQRLPDEFMDSFQPDDETEELDTGVLEPISVDNPVIHTEDRRVQCYEIDPNGHVNHAVYARWIDQSLSQSLRAAGWPPERLAFSDFRMIPISHEIEYLRGALGDEPIRIATGLFQFGLDRASWQTEIQHGATGDPIARSTYTFGFVDERGPRSIPDALHFALIGIPQE